VQTDVSDEDDWSRAIHGDGEAFGRIFDRHRARVYRHCVRVVPTTADADDAVAITFLEAWRRRDTARLVEGSLLPWLLLTATNSARNLSRSIRRYRALLAQLPASPDEPDHASRFDEGDAHTALKKLSLADQQIITLCVLEGLSEKDAAATLAIPAGTVKSRLSRAKSRLERQFTALQPTLISQEAPNEY
jgi:RNA polymerase sigma-70 factor (ECF subfamily)